MLIDSHAHLDVFKKDLDEIIERAKKEGVKGIITVGIDLKSSIKAIEIAKRYDGIYAAVGFHPHNAKKVTEDQLERLVSLSSEKKVIAWGEIGLDFYKNYSPKDIQIDVLKKQLDITGRLNLPVIIHDREAHDQVYEILKEAVNKYGIRGVIHCFSGDSELAKRFIEMGFYISIPGTVTYSKASKIRRVVSDIALDYLLIETDSPFLTPYQKRGKKNEPSFVKFVAQEISLIKGIEFDIVSQKITENTKRLFNIDEI